MKFPGGLVTSDYPVTRLHIEEGPRLRAWLPHYFFIFFLYVRKSAPALLSPETQLSYAAGPVDE